MVWVSCAKRLVRLHGAVSVGKALHCANASSMLACSILGLDAGCRMLAVVAWCSIGWQGIALRKCIEHACMQHPRDGCWVQNAW